MSDLTYPAYQYERLDAAATALLRAESARVVAHVTTVLLFESGPLATADGGVDFAAIRHAIASALPQAHRLRQRLRWIPVERTPVFVDDRHFTLDYHLRHTSAPRPGRIDQLNGMVSRIGAQQLDRSRPLWECWVVEGLRDGRFALIMKTHLAMIDPRGLPDLLEVVLSSDAQARPALPGAYTPAPAPSALELLIDEVIRRGAVPRQLLERIRQVFDDPEATSRRARSQFNALAARAGYAIRGADTPLAGSIGPHRRFETLDFPLHAFRNVARRMGATVNDVVLATLAGGLGAYLFSHRVHPTTLDVRVAQPIAQPDGRFTEWYVDLPLWEKDPRQRVRRVAATTGPLAVETQPRTAESLGDVDQWVGGRRLAVGVRHALLRPRADIMLANIPAPTGRFHLAGAPLVGWYGQVPLRDDGPLAVAVTSGGGRITWGLNGDYDRLPDVGLLATEIASAFNALCDAVGEPIDGAQASSVA